MSSETRSIVRCAARTSSPSAGASTGAARRDLEREPPDPVEEPGRPLDAGVAPLLVLLGRAHEEDVEPQRVGAVARDRLVGRDDVPLRLRHLRAVAVDHPLGEEARERLAEAEQLHVVQHLREEARVEQVQDGVLDAADVLVDGQPVVDDLLVPRPPRRSARRRSGGSTRTSRRTCPSCPSRAVPGRRTSGRSSSTQSSAAASGERPFGR